MTGQTSFARVPTAWTYNNLSEILTEMVGTGNLAQTTTNTWDTLGDKLTTQDANGTTSMGYNLVGAMTSLTDPDHNQTVWTRDNLGRVTAEQNPSGTETFAYDSNSNLTQQVDFDGHERDFVFDDLNRETAEKWISGGTAINTINTAYNADGQVTSTGDNYSEYAFAFNGQGDQTSVDNAGTPNAPHVVLNSVFDAQGERTSLAATLNGTADFINSYGYDALSRLNQIDQHGQNGGNAVSQKSIYVGYDGVGDITQLDYGNMVSQGPQQNGPGYATLSYSPTTGLLTGINDVANGTSIDNLAYSYDALARVSTFTSVDGTATYGYDHTSQLVSATYTTATGGHQPANQSFTWDANGNNAAPGNVVSPNNEVTNDGTFTYTFDANGNRISRTRISDAYASDYKTTYTWDYRNRLTDVETFDNNGVLTKHVHYVFDVFDNLIEEDIDPNGGGKYTTVEQFALDVVAQAPSAGSAPLEHFDASGNLIPSAPADTLLEFLNGALGYRFLNGPSPSGADVIYAEGNVASLVQPDVTDWLFVNNQGSPTETVASSGNPIDHQVWSAFGQDAYESNPSVFHLQGFSGGIFDPNTGLIKDGERWYDPLATVWISFDPAGFRGRDADLTRYAANAATIRTDPSGLWAEAGEDKTGGYDPNAGKTDTTFPYGDGKSCPVRFTNIDSDHQDAIKDLLNQLFDKLVALNAQIKNAQVTKDNPLIQKWFGNLTDAQFKKVAGVLNKIQSVLGKGRGALGPALKIEAVAKCDEGANAYNNSIGWGAIKVAQPDKTVYLCPRFFDKTIREQIGILFHELSHVWGSTDDYGYWDGNGYIDRKGNPVNLGTDKLIDNADTYGNFLQGLL